MSDTLEIRPQAQAADAGSTLPVGPVADLITHAPAAVDWSTPAPPHPGLSDTVRARLRRDFLPRWTHAWGGRFFADGRMPGPDAIRLDGNDYLSISGHPRIIAAQIEALRHSASFISQSGIFQKSTQPSARFEADLARWLQAPDVVLCQSGYAANLGLLQVIAEPGSPVYIDALAHMSLWEGIRAAGACARPFRHNNPEHLARCIRANGPGIVVVDAVYSTTGALCPLAEIIEVAERGACMIVVDESHSLGTHGPQGRGLCMALGLTHRVHFITASLAKAFAGRAGFFTLPRELRPYLMVSSFPNVFSSCLAPYEVIGLQATLEVVQEADDLRQRLHGLTVQLRQHLMSLGYPVGQGTEQIIALEAGPEPATLALRDKLEARGVFGAVFCAPATTRDRAMVRLTLNAGLTDPEVQRFADVFTELAPEIEPQGWPIVRRQRLRGAAADCGASEAADSSDAVTP